MWVSRRRDRALTYNVFRGARVNVEIEAPNEKHSPRYWTDRLDWAGWMGHARASEGRPYTIGNHQMKAVSPLSAPPFLAATQANKTLDEVVDCNRFHFAIY